MDYKEYSRQRDIAVKRLKRLSAKGQDLGINVPTVKQLRSMPEDQASKMMSALTNFLQTGASLRKQQESRRIHYSREEQSSRRNEYQRQYRRRVKAREYERPKYPHKYESYVKALGSKKLKNILDVFDIDIKPSMLPAFFKYLDMRFDQGDTSKEYVIDVFLTDYVKYLKKGYKGEDILRDFDEFVSDQLGISNAEEEMKGYSLEEFQKTWRTMIGNKPELY